MERLSQFLIRDDRKGERGRVRERNETEQKKNTKKIEIMYRKIDYPSSFQTTVTYHERVVQFFNVETENAEARGCISYIQF